MVCSSGIYLSLKDNKTVMVEILGIISVSHLLVNSSYHYYFHFVFFLLNFLMLKAVNIK